MVTDAIMITMAMLIDLKLLHWHSAGEVEVEVRRVGERIEQLIHFVVRSVYWRSNGN